MFVANAGLEIIGPLLIGLGAAPMGFLAWIACSFSKAWAAAFWIAVVSTLVSAIWTLLFFPSGHDPAEHFVRGVAGASLLLCCIAVMFRITNSISESRNNLIIGLAPTILTAAFVIDVA